MNPLKMEMPNCMETEQMLLGACIMRKECFDKAVEHLAPDDFFYPQHEIIWEHALFLYRHGMMVDRPAIISRIKNEHGFNDVDGAQNYIDLICSASIYTGKAVEEKSKELLSLAKRRRFISLIEDVHNGAFDERSEIDKIISSFEAELFLLGKESEGRGPSLDYEAKTLAEIEAAMKGEITGISTGFAGIDKVLGGLGKSDLVILAGRPSMGKTALAMSIADNVVSDGKHVLFASLEMSATQLHKRRIATSTGIAAEKLRTGELDDIEMRKVFYSEKDAKAGELWIDDQPMLSVDQLLTRARRLASVKQLSLIVVDYLQLMQGSGISRRHGKVAEVTEISAGLKGIAKDLDLPVLALAQLSRAVEQREDKRPMLSDLRESGAIEQDADSVMFVYRDEYYLERGAPKQKEKESAEKFNERVALHLERIDQAVGKADVIVAKNRHGKIDTVKVAFDAKTTRFRCLDAED